jgi:hypothetical protein
LFVSLSYNLIIKENYGLVYCFLEKNPENLKQLIGSSKTIKMSVSVFSENPLIISLYLPPMA